MHFLLALLTIWRVASQDVYDDQTIISLHYNGSSVDVVNLPVLLANLGVQGDQRVASFISTSPIKTLRSAQCQIVPTSTDSVSHDDLCNYLYQAKQHLPHLAVTCARNIVGQLAKLDDELYIDDPFAYMQTYFHRMSMAAVWESIQEYPRKNVTVAVIDSGVNFTDPDIAPLKVLFETEDGKVIDGGWNFHTNDTNIIYDYHGHFVSRLLAARGNNSFGVVGVAPDHVTLVSLQVCSAGACPLVYLVEAIDMAIDIEVDVVSMSLRYFINTYSNAERSLLEDILRRAQEEDIILVSGAGNENIFADNCYPCWNGGPNGICVAALSDGPDYELAGFSNYGDRVDIAAFGQNLYLGTSSSGNHVTSSGTSYATPIVSGAVAILLSLGVDPLMVKRLLLAGADHFETPGRPIRHDGGALNILASVKRAISFYDLRPIPRPLQ